MKYAILLCFLIMGCFSLKPYSTPEVVNYYGFDFTKYTAEGFLFTPLTYTGLYDSKGIVRVEVYPEVKIVKKQVKTSTSSYMEDMPIVSEVKVETLLDKAYQFARNLRYQSLSVSFTSHFNTAPNPCEATLIGDRGFTYSM